MHIGIIGSGRIGANIGRRAAEAGHDVVFSFSRDPDKLARLAAEVGGNARAGTPANAAGCDVVVLSVPWARIDDALAQAGSLAGRIVADTTNPYGPDGIASLPDGETTGRYNASRIPGARLVKTFNTYTSAFQTGAQAHPGATAMFICGDDADAKRAVGDLVRLVGFEPVDLGSLDTGAIMDAPRRVGAVYGEAYGPDDAREIARLNSTDPQAAAVLAKTRKQ